jgi:hypothetical protein
MKHNSRHIPRDDGVADIALVLQGYTISTGTGCLARIGKHYVMRGAGRRCARIPVGSLDLPALASSWLDFGKPAAAPAAKTNDDVALVLQGYTISAGGYCLARIGAHYVMRAGRSRCIRLPVAIIDAGTLAKAWAAFRGAAPRKKPAVGKPGPLNPPLNTAAAAPPAAPAP